MKKNGTAAFLAAVLVFFPAFLSAQEFPVRVIAGVDIVDLRQGRYAVHEFLDVYNDDYRYAVQVEKVSADTWTGHRIDRLDEPWLDRPEKPTVPPDSVVRIADRERVVQGYPRMDWWVRWIKFKVVTDKGTYESNFISSPLEKRSIPISNKAAPQVEQESAPHYPWRLPDPYVSGPGRR